VGLYNHGYFLLFCLYLTASCTLAFFPFWLTLLPETIHDPIVPLHLISLL
jgi:hypothetical protein